MRAMQVAIRISRKETSRTSGVDLIISGQRLIDEFVDIVTYNLWYLIIDSSDSETNRGCLLSDWLIM